MSETEPRILLVFHTGEGQTARIAQRIADRLRVRGAAVEVHEADDAPAPSDFDVVVLGDSVHMQHHSRALRRYARQHTEAIQSRPSALFQVSLASSARDEEHDHLANKYVADLLAETDLDPDVVGLFAGAIAYTRYGWIKRKIMARIAASEGQPTDTSRDVELTDWNDVDHFADDVGRLAFAGS